MRKFIEDVNGTLEGDKLYINGYRFIVKQSTLNILRENNKNYQKYVQCVLKETETQYKSEVDKIAERKSRKTLEEILQSD